MPSHTLVLANKSPQAGAQTPYGAYAVGDSFGNLLTQAAAAAAAQPATGTAAVTIGTTVASIIDAAGGAVRRVAGVSAASSNGASLVKVV
jgi:hypothetical protein